MTSNFGKKLKENNDNCKPASTINNVSGSKDICEMWKNHFGTLLNSSVDMSCKTEVYNLINTSNVCIDSFSIHDVIAAIDNLKVGKACGLDNVFSEHLKYAHDKLSALLSILFNAVLTHDFLPATLLDTIIDPLLKDKQGDIGDKDNYHPLALTYVVSNS